MSGTPAGRAGPPRSSIDFRRINNAVLPSLLSLLNRWLAGGRLNGREYVVRNPRRADRRPGSLLINVRTGAWANFATGDEGGDPISLAAYLANISQIEAAGRDVRR